MSSDLGTLSAAAFTIGLVHCVCGPDHYVPFVAMSRVGLWSLRKTLLVTFLCGVGHVAGSAVLGFIGIALGLILFQLETFEGQLQTFEGLRGNLAGWLLVAFGAVYLIWGVVHAWRQPSAARRASDDEVLDAASEKAASLSGRAGSLTPWVLFVIFLFGPCEPLIPLLMYPAAQANLWSVIFVTTIFGLTTLVTMVALVAMIYLGTLAVQMPRALVYGHAVAGAIVLASGLAVVLGL